MTTTPNPRPAWHSKYAEELERYPELLAALYEGSPIWTVARRAKLSELETWVIEGWADGKPERDLAQDCGRARATIREVAIKAERKVLLWLVRSGPAHP